LLEHWRLIVERQPVSGASQQYHLKTGVSICACDLLPFDQQ
jgi:hypothetical protein